MKFLSIQFWRMRHALKPRANFKAALWSKLALQWDARQLPSYAWYETHWFRIGIAACAGFMLVGAFNTAAYAYTSPEVTEGTPLYPVKQALENVEESTKTTPAAKAQFYLKKIRRREAESVVLAQKQQRAKKTENEIRHAEKQLENVNEKFEREPDNVKLRVQVRDRLDRRKLQLQKKIEKLLK